MATNYKDKKLQVLLNGINVQLQRKNMSKNIKCMELLAAQAILKKQLKKIHEAQHHQLKQNIFLAIILLLVLVGSISSALLITG